MKVSVIALSAAAALVGSAHAAATSTLLENYDSTFAPLCGGTDCEQAVGEFRNGADGGPAESIGTLGFNTATPGEEIRLSSPGFWDNEPRKFAFSYDDATGDLTLVIDLDRDGELDDEIDTGNNDGRMVFSGADLSATNSLYIRAVSAGGNPDTVLSGLELNGMSIGTLTGDEVADYLLVEGIDFGASWMLIGDLTMAGGTGGSFRGSRPSVQFKLTDLGEIPVPAAAWLFATALGAVGVR